MQPEQDFTFSGTVSTGKGMSTRHMSSNLTTLREALGYEPVPGTLNIQTGKKIARKVASLAGGVPIKTGEKEIVYHEMTMLGMDIHVVAYRYGIEVVAPVHMRKQFGLVDGDSVTISARTQF